MKKIHLLLIVVIGLAALLMTGCNVIIGTGDTVTREYEFRDFNRIEIGSAFRFEITQSDSYSVSVSTRENVIEHLDIRQSGNTLIIRLKPGSYTNVDTRAAVTLPGLERLEVSGASQGEVSGFQSSNAFEMLVSGASRVEMEMEAGNTSLDISGASRVNGSLRALNFELALSGASRCELEGSAGDADLDISGASQMNAGNFHLENADVEVSGASKAFIYTTGTLNVDVTGASTLEYSGNPTLGKVNVNGASRLNKQ